MITKLAQFLCVMNGGKLIQNVSNHAMYFTHPITDGKYEFEITSTHHQMQYPFELEDNKYSILFYTVGRSNVYQGDSIDVNKIVVEPEIVLYHQEDKPRCLAIQGHPEYMSKDSAAVIEINNIISNLLNK